jgi:hypothetical protein
MVGVTSHLRSKSSIYRDSQRGPQGRVQAITVDMKSSTLLSCFGICFAHASGVG